MSVGPWSIYFLNVYEFYWPMCIDLGRPGDTFAVAGDRASLYTKWPPEAILFFRLMPKKGVFMTKVCHVQVLACGGGGDGVGATKNIISPKFSNFGAMIMINLTYTHNKMWFTLVPGINTQNVKFNIHWYSIDRNGELIVSTLDTSTGRLFIRGEFRSNKSYWIK